MRVTNRYSLPTPLVRAVSHDRPYEPGVISVTSLIKPPQMYALEIAHDDEIEEDASDRIWMLLGSAVHSVLERAQVDNVLQEEELRTSVLGWTVTGRPDLYEEPGTLDDYKVTSVYAFLNGVKVEWEQQINAYAWLFRLHGFPVEEARIVAILRDWSKSKVNGSDYPPAASLTLPVVLWSAERQAQFVEDRVRLHQAVIEGRIEAPPCTAEERWRRATTYAVTKFGNKRAARVLDTLDEADAWRAEQAKPNDFFVEQRLGASVRCESYCRVAQFCPQYQMMLQERADADQGTY
jgi:hypothetical protein